MSFRSSRRRSATTSRARLLADDAGVLLDVGKFHLMSRTRSAARRSKRACASTALHASRYFLAVARLAQGRASERARC